MWFQARRFRADLRRVGGWVVSIASVTFVISILATYTATFAVADGRTGALTTAPPHEPLGFLRAIDPNDSIATVVDSVDELDAVLEAPGLQVLLDRMTQDERMFITLPLDAFVLNARSATTMDTDATAVLGTAPPFLDRAPSGDVALLWGSLFDASQAARPVAGSIGGHQIRQASARPLAAEYVTGSGHLAQTGDRAVVAFDVPTGRDLGVSYPYSVSEVVEGFTCYCAVADLTSLADAMSQAESRAGTGRGFYAVAYNQVVGPVERSRALTETLNAAHAVGTLLAVSCLVIMAAQVFWARRSPIYQVERLSGSHELAIQVRGQLLIGLSLTLPALAGYGIIVAIVRSGAWPPPLPASAGLVAIAAVVALHVLAGGPTAIRTHRLCQLSEDEVRRA